MERHWLASITWIALPRNTGPTSPQATMSPHDLSTTPEHPAGPPCRENGSADSFPAGTSNGVFRNEYVEPRPWGLRGRTRSLSSVQKNDRILLANPQQ